MKKRFDKKFETIVSTELDKIVQNTITRVGNNVECFGKYVIIPDAELFAVKKNNIQVARFNSLKIAVSWCVADKADTYGIGRQIFNIGTTLVVKATELKFASRYAKQVINDSSRFAVAQDKLSEIYAKINYSTKQLDKLIDLTKYIQIKGMNNEPPRFRKEADSKIAKNV